MGMAGIPWFTTDMGGFHDGIIDSDDFKELLARWCAFSCFLPVMRNHGDRSLHTTTGKETITTSAGDHRSPSGADNEPWSYGPETEQIFRKFIAIREKMRPYTRELFESAHTDGQPLVRGLFYEFPQDESVSDIADEYMFGPDILVAPVVEAGARSREVTLPGNASITWTDLRTGKVYEGGAKNHCRRRNRHDSSLRTRRPRSRTDRNAINSRTTSVGRPFPRRTPHTLRIFPISTGLSAVCMADL